MVYTLSGFCCFLGFFMLYNTSGKAKLSAKGVFERWLQQHKPVAKLLGLLCVMVPFILLPLNDGTAIGILTAFLLLMAAAALMITIAPFHYLRLKHIIALVAFSFLLESLFF